MTKRTGKAFIGRLLLRPVWLVTWPIRAYWLHSDRKLGKRLVIDGVLKRVLPAPPRGFVATVPGGARVRLHYREDIGLTTILGGGFETIELELAAELALPGTVAVDVGANVGLHTAVLAAAVGADGRVLAFEPEPSNLGRLAETIAENGFKNVELHPFALASTSGVASLHLATDPAFHSLGEIFEGRSTHASLRVETRRLDDVVTGLGLEGNVSFVKIDTEGTELSVLEGAEALLREHRPVLIVEANDRRVEPWLVARGYVAYRPSRFAVGNVLFRPSAAAGIAPSTGAAK